MTISIRFSNIGSTKGDKTISGTKEGGLKTRDTNRKRHGKLFYARIGQIGGRNGHTGGFGQGDQGRERARKAGVTGGSNSVRSATLRQDCAHWDEYVAWCEVNFVRPRVKYYADWEADNYDKDTDGF